MRPTLISILLLSFAGLLTGCCGKTCDIDVHIFLVNYYGFPKEETGMLYVYSYSANSGFKTLLAKDSVYTTPRTDTAAFAPAIPGRGIDYIFELKNGRRDSVSNFEWAEAVCSICPGRKEVYPYISGYYLNGLHFSGSEINIYK